MPSCSFVTKGSCSNAATEPESRTSLEPSLQQAPPGRPGSSRVFGGAGLKTSLRGEPVVELVIRGKTPLLGEEIGGYGNALSALLGAQALGAVEVRAFGRSSRGLRLACRSRGCAPRSLAGSWWSARWLPVRRRVGFGPGSGLGLVGFHESRLSESRRRGQLFGLRSANLRNPARVNVVGPAARDAPGTHLASHPSRAA